MKKLLALFLALSMLFALAACGGKEAAKDETTEAPKPATLEEALDNTAAELEKAENLTAKVDVDLSLAGEKINAALEMKIHLDGTVEEFSSVEQMSGVVNIQLPDDEIEGYVHKGNVIVYNEEEVAYYKTPIVGQTDDDEDAAQGVQSVLDQIPAGATELLKEYVDLEKLFELLEKVDVDALTEQMEYTTVTEGDTIIHTYKPDVVALAKNILEQVKDAFASEEIYDGLVSTIEELVEEVEIELTFEMIQENDKINTFQIGAVVNAEDEEVFDLDCTIELTDIGTTEVDLEELDSLLEQALEMPTTPVMGEGSIVGMVSGTSYYNEFMALAADLDEEYWLTAGPAEASVLMGFSTSEEVSAEEVLEQVGTFCDFYALYADQMSNVNIMITKETEESKELTDEEFIAQSKASVVSGLEAGGLTNVQTEEAIIAFADAEYNGLIITSEMGLVKVYQTQVLIRYGDYAMTITATSFDEDLTGAFLSYFYGIF